MHGGGIKLQGNTIDRFQLLNPDEGLGVRQIKEYISKAMVKMFFG